MRDVLVLCYHGISDTWPSPGAVAPARLEEQLEYLVRRGYRGTTFTQALLAPPARRTLAVTFDDAFRSIFVHAFPILRRFGLPGTLFVPTHWIDGQEPLAWEGIDRWLETEHANELTPMSWAQIGDLAENGWEIGSHSRSHRELTPLDDESLAVELSESKSDCEDRLGRSCEAFSYPYGAVDARVIRAVERAGYRTGAALPPVVHRRRVLEWPRVGIYASDTPERFLLKASPVRRRLYGRGLGGGILRCERRLRRRIGRPLR